MSTDQPIRHTLPPHLVGRIRCLLEYDIARQLDQSLKDDLERAVDAAGTTSSVGLGNVGAPSSVQALAAEAADYDVIMPAAVNEPNNGAPTPTKSVAADPPPPPTIPEETLEQVARWADTKAGRGILKRYKPGEYSMVSLLAGTQVYIPPSRLARLRAAEVTDKPNPFLPTYLSPKPPSLGREFSSLTKQLTTTLNVLFSIFGSAFAVYVAGTTGAGYSRETSILLGILAGAVVGVAEAVLVWIFSTRVKEGRKERWARGARLGRGSAGLGPKEVLDKEEKEKEDEFGIAEIQAPDVGAQDGNGQPRAGSTASRAQGMSVIDANSATAIETGGEKGIKLRRRPLGVS